MTLNPLSKEFYSSLWNELKKERYNSVLDNKYCSLTDFRRAAPYFLTFSTLAGLGNMSKAENEYLQYFLGAFTRQIPVSILINLNYAKLITYLSKFKNGRTYSNLISLTLATSFTAYHMLVGTENPISTGIPMAVFGLILTNGQVSSVRKKNKGAANALSYQSHPERKRKQR